MTRQTSKKELRLAQAMAQPQHSSVDISFKELFNESYKYTIRPKYQRELVWNLRQKQQFIDSLFLGDPFAPVEGYEGFIEWGEHIGENKWEIGDGQNRVFTLLEFMSDGFKTMTVAQKMRYDPSSQVGPVQPGKFFSEIDPIAKNYFLGYRLRIDKLRDRPESEKATRFLRVQNHVVLTAAERLKVYASKAKEATTRIEEHSFWKNFYEGKHNHGQIFQSSLYLLALEMAAPEGIVDLQSGGFIQGLIYGNHDDKITDALVDAVLTRLDVVSHMYSGTVFTRRIAIVAMYQSIIFLEQSGFVARSADKGLLTPWIGVILDETRRSSGIPSYAKPIQALVNAKGQREFWAKHRGRMMSLCGVNAPQLQEAGV